MEEVVKQRNNGRNHWTCHFFAQNAFVLHTHTLISKLALPNKKNFRNHEDIKSQKQPCLPKAKCPLLFFSPTSTLKPVKLLKTKTSFVSVTRNHIREIIYEATLKASMFVWRESWNCPDSRILSVDSRPAWAKHLLMALCQQTPNAYGLHLKKIICRVVLEQEKCTIYAGPKIWGHIVITLLFSILFKFYIILLQICVKTRLWNI